MKKDFDFDDIGKRTPYRTPDGFFEDMQRRVMERAGVKQRRKSHLKLIVSAVVTMAAILAGFLFVPSLRQINDVKSPSSILAVDRSNGTDAVDKWIKELSDEELEELVSFSKLSNSINYLKRKDHEDEIYLCTFGCSPVGESDEPFCSKQ